MARSDAQHNHRLPPALKSLLDDAARANKRSLTAEINARLEQSFSSSVAGKTLEGGESPVPALLGLDRKLSALCSHLGVKLES